MSDVHPVASLSAVFCVICRLWKATLQVLYADKVNKAFVKDLTRKKRAMLAQLRSE